MPAGLGRYHREACAERLYRQTIERLAEIQVREPAGVRDRRLYRSHGAARGYRRIAGRRLSKREAEVCRQSRHRIRYEDAERPRKEIVGNEENDHALFRGLASEDRGALG